MGAALSAVGGVAEMAKNIISSDEDDEKVAEMRERLTFLQTMAYTTLDAKTDV